MSGLSTNVLILDEVTVDPADAGGSRYRSDLGEFRMRDSLGVFNPRSGSGNIEDVLTQFTFSDASPKILATLAAGEWVTSAELVIQSAFNDPLSTLSVGTAADPNAILSTSMVYPAYEFNYMNSENYIAGASTSIILTLSPGSATAGSGYVLLQIKRS